MKRILREAARLVVGSFAVYVVFAACSAGGNPKQRLTVEDRSPDGGLRQARDGGLPRIEGSAGRGPLPGDGSIIDPIIDPVPPANAEPTDGSRLKAIYRVAQDGAREPVAGLWWDSERGEECTWRRAADGVHRCLPTALAPGSPLFADASCTQDAVLILRAFCAPGQVPPPYVTSTIAECTSDVRTRVLRLGATSPTIYNATADGTCVDLTATYSPSYVFYLASEVPASGFVGSTLEHD